MKRVFLHACCAVCAAYPLNLLKEEGYELSVYFFNPNIHPQAEHNRRFEELKKYCGKNNIPLIYENFEPDGWYDYVKGLENEPEKGIRCEKCFEYRLEKTAKKALESGYELFTTTLSVSPHKNSQTVLNTGIKIAQKYGIKFLEKNFKKNDGFLKTTIIAKENSFYRQQYCGCEFSIRNSKEKCEEESWNADKMKI